MRLLILLLPFYLYTADNQITIQQSGDNLNLNIEQVGYSNVIRRWRSWDDGIIGDNNSLDIRQHKIKEVPLTSI